MSHCLQGLQAECCVSEWKVKCTPSVEELLPDNLDLCQKRLFGLIRRLKLSPHILRDYDNIIQDKRDRGGCGPSMEQLKLANCTISLTMASFGTTKLLSSAGSSMMPQQKRLDLHSTIAFMLVHPLGKNC